ncbi:hypothetical protein HII17_01855 [Thalassotalea sp. M1531]|uniref:Uncharacterized protein n=1 Tax=Thalassotalea algicola TaxID=2716224 RepID=A0A7Y0L9L1_9GAMM|nr:hypothetical protein [Thalassotalea algicola]NMP30292.1 hypothetical protein [Thalassotalea algicola]
MKLVCATLCLIISSLCVAEDRELTDNSSIEKHIKRNVEQIEITRDDISLNQRNIFDFTQLASYNHKLTPNITDTGLHTGSEQDNLGVQRYIQGTYTLLSYNTLDIAITAKLASVEAIPLGSLNYAEFLKPSSYRLSQEQFNNTTLGIIGKYQLSNNWAIVGSLSTTALSESLVEKASLHNELAHTALIGATYSF